VSVLLASHHSHSVFYVSFTAFLNFQLYECLGRLRLTLALHLQPSISLTLADYIASTQELATQSLITKVAAILISKTVSLDVPVYSGTLCNDVSVEATLQSGASRGS